MNARQPPKRLGVLASGGGTNLQATIDACRAGVVCGRVALVVSNNSDSGALARAKRHDIEGIHLSSNHYPDPEDLDLALAEILISREVDLLLALGYMKKVGARTSVAAPMGAVNIHPSLLPSHGGRGMYGMRVHEAVLRSGDAETGVSVHYINNQYDDGPVVAQRSVPVESGDTADTLAARVRGVEHSLLIESLVELCGAGCQSSPDIEQSTS